MLNHANEEEYNCNYMYKTNVGLQVTAASDLRAGDQLLINYGHRSDDELLLNYGFVMG